jgi:hypothetical protein
MWHHVVWMTFVLSSMGLSGCSFDSTPKRLTAYLPPPSPEARTGASSNGAFPVNGVTAALIVLNDTNFEKSAPKLRRETLQHLGEHLKSTLEKQLPIHVSSVVYPEDLSPQESSEAFTRLAKEQNVSYLLLAVVSSSEREVFERLPMQGNQGGGGMRSIGMPGYRAENYARVELALLDGQTGQPVVSTDGQAWATLERLAVPMESNVYPVVRRAQTQPPIFPNSEGDAFETLRWISGQDAIAQAVMHLEQLWKKKQTA